MPAVNPSNDRYLATTIKNILQRLTNLEGQQNGGVRDAQGNIRVKWGMQSDGTYGLWIFNPSGVVEAKLGDQGQGVAAGPYGLSVLNPAGNMQLVSGRTIATAAGPLTYSSLSLGALSGGPSVQVQVGPSGAVDVALSALIQPVSYSAGETAWLYPAVNGAAASWPYLQASVGVSSSQAMTAYGEAQITGLSPGTLCTFTVQAAVTTAGISATYREVTIDVTPV